MRSWPLILAAAMGCAHTPALKELELGLDARHASIASAARAMLARANRRTASFTALPTSVHGELTRAADATSSAVAFAGLEKDRTAALKAAPTALEAELARARRLGAVVAETRPSSVMHVPNRIRRAIQTLLELWVREQELPAPGDPLRLPIHP